MKVLTVVITLTITILISCGKDSKNKDYITQPKTENIVTFNSNDRCDMITLQALALNKIKPDMIDLLKRSNMGPIFKVHNDPTSEYVGLATCSYIQR